MFRKKKEKTKLKLINLFNELQFRYSETTVSAYLIKILSIKIRTSNDIIIEDTFLFLKWLSVLILLYLILFSL